MKCAACDKEIPGDSAFCSYCGARQIELTATDTDKADVFRIIGLFYGIDLLLCLIIKFVDGLQKFRYYVIFDVLTALITVVFIASTFKYCKDSLKWNNFSFRRLLTYILIAILSAIVVHLLVTWLNRSLFDDEFYYFYAFENTKSPMLFMLLSMAVQPAIFEELGYRGLIVSQLNRIIDQKQVIFISAFLFALIHLSIFSMIWIFPFAILLGYIRQKENTIWYGVFVHFFFNATVCIIELFNLDIL